MYDILNNIINEANDENRNVILGADFDAQTGAATEHSDTKTVGAFAIEPGNSRGDWLRKWASKSNLVITTYALQKTIATYTNTRRPKQGAQTN